MKVTTLVPMPSNWEPFRRNRERYVPEVPGCYVLTTFEQYVLYVGLSNNLRRRMNEHLDSPTKTMLTPKGRAVVFYWLQTADTNKVERTWLNIHLLNEGVLPLLNNIYSPTAI